MCTVCSSGASAFSSPPRAQQRAPSAAGAGAAAADGAAEHDDDDDDECADYVTPPREPGLAEEWRKLVCASERRPGDAPPTSGKKSKSNRARPAAAAAPRR